MGIFDALDPLFKTLQYPQSVYSGVVGALNHVAPTEELKKRNQGRSALDELARGFAGGLTPSEVDAIDKSTVGGRAQVGIEDVLLDPLNFLGGIAKTGALGERAGNIIEAANATGKQAGLGNKAAQFTRRAYEGYKASDQDPTAAITSAPLTGLVESKLAPLISGRLGKLFPQTRTDDEIIDSLGALVKAENPADVASKVNVDPLMEENYQNAVHLLNQVGPGKEIELASRPDTGGGLDQLIRNMQNDVPTGRATPELPIGNSDLPQMPIQVGRVPPGQAIERMPGDTFQGISRLNLGDMTRTPPGLNAGSVGELNPAPVPMEVGSIPPDMQPYLSRNPEMQLSPEILQEIMLKQRGIPKGLPAGGGWQRPSFSRFDDRLLPERMRNKPGLEEFLLNLIK